MNPLDLLTAETQAVVGEIAQLMIEEDGIDSQSKADFTKAIELLSKVRDTPSVAIAIRQRREAKVAEFRDRVVADLQAKVAAAKQSRA